MTDMFIQRPTVNTPEVLAAKYEIKELLEFERFCRDNAQWDEMRKCFTRDSRVNVSWFQGTGAEFVTATAQMNSYAPHKIYDTLIWVNGDRAVAIMMAEVQIRRMIDGVEYEVDSDVRLVTSVVKENGLWYISRFECIYDKDELKAVVPDKAMDISKEEIAQYRESYACLSYITAKTGMNISQEMLGRDRPELVGQLYRDLDVWLYGRR